MKLDDSRTLFSKSMGSGFPVAAIWKCISPSEEDDFMLYVCNDLTCLCSKDY